jgi:hypothetical protein
MGTNEAGKINIIWAHNSAPYMNDTLVGIFVFAFTVLIPMEM